MIKPLVLGAPPPSGWRSLRLKDITTWVSRGTAPQYSDDDSELIAFSQKCVRSDLAIAPEHGRPIVPGTVAEYSPARLRIGDVVVNSTGRGTLGRAAVVLSQPSVALVADGHVTVVRSQPEFVQPRFLAYLFGTDAFYEQANACLAVGATNQTELNREPLRRLCVHVPPLEAQQRIADYLDTETARIDELITEQRHHEILLEERFRSLLVTRMVDREANARETRVRLKVLFEFERNGYWGDESKGDRNDVTCVRVADFDRRRFTAGRSAETVRNVPPEQRLPRLLKRGDVLLEKSGGTSDKPVGCAVTYDLDDPAICSNFMAVLRPVSGVHARWAGLLMAALYQARLNAPFVKQTTGIQNLDSARYLGIHAWLPPTAQQRRQAEEIDECRDRVSTLRSQIEDQIRLLQEHRQALITHAVTHGVGALQGMA